MTILSSGDQSAQGRIWRVWVGDIPICGTELT